VTDGRTDGQTGTPYDSIIIRATHSIVR